METMLKVKINSELRFPTKEYLNFKENKCSNEDLMSDNDYEYELVGITVQNLEWLTLTVIIPSSDNKQIMAH